MPSSIMTIAKATRTFLTYRAGILLQFERVGDFLVTHPYASVFMLRIIEFLPDGTMIDKVSTYDEYLESDVMARKRQVYNTTADEEADD